MASNRIVLSFSEGLLQPGISRSCPTDTSPQYAVLLANEHITAAQSN